MPLYLQVRLQVVYAAPEANMPMPTNLMLPPSSCHAMDILEHAYLAPALNIPPSPKVAGTL